MGQQTLDQLFGKPKAAEAPVPGGLDDLFPEVKNKKGNLLTQGIGMAVSPIPGVSEAAQSAANVIEGVDRKVVPSQRRDASELLPKSTEEAGWMGAELSGVPSIVRAAMALPGAANAVLNPFASGRKDLKGRPVADPMAQIAAARGAVAGTVEGLGQVTPLDIALLLIGKGKKAEVKGAFEKPIGPKPRVTPAPEGAPKIGRNAYEGSRLVRTPKENLGEALQKVAEEVRANKEPVTNVELPPSEHPAPRAGTRQGPSGPAIPEPGGNLDFVKDSVSNSMRTLHESMMRAAEGTVEEGGSAGRGAARARKFRPLKPPPKPPVQGNKLPVERPREPEVLAPRDKNLENLAAEMEANKAAGAGESPVDIIPGGYPNEAVANPAASAAEALRRAGIEPPPELAQAAQPEVAATVPANGVKPAAAEVFTPEAQKALMLELAADPAAVAGAKELMAKKAGIDATRKLSPPREAPATQLGAEQQTAEAAATHIPAQSPVVESASKPVPGETYKDFRDRTGLPASEAGPIYRASPKQSSDLPSVPVKKIPAAQTRAVPAAKLDLANLSAGEKVKITNLEKRLPGHVKKAIQEGKSTPRVSTDMLDAANDYRELYDKSQGKVKAAPAPVMLKPELKASTPAAATRFEELSKSLPAEVKSAIDEGRGLPQLDKETFTKHADSIFEYAHLRDKLGKAKAIDDLARSNVEAAAKAEGVAAPKAESTVARSEEVAKEIAPAPVEPVSPPPKVTDKAIDEVLAETPADRRIRQEVEEQNIDKMLEDRYKDKGKPKAKPTIRPYIRPEDIGPPPEGVEPRMWKRMNAVEAEAKRLIKGGVKDARLVHDMRQFWGSEEAARRLGIPKTEVEALSGAPSKRKPFSVMLRDLQAEGDARIKRAIDDPRGFMRTEALVAGGAAVAGGMYGATIDGDSIEDHAANAIAGAIIGGLAGLGAVKGAKALPGAAKNAAHTVEAIDTANMLAGPAAIKASFGSVGGISAAIWQRLQEGRVADAKRGLRFMKSEAAAKYWKTLTGPSSQTKGIGHYSTQVSGMAAKAGLADKILGFVLRPFIAGDAVGIEAMKRMGFSAEEGQRFMVNGDPVSWQGQAILRAVNSTWISRMLGKFPRVRIGGLERAIEFTPGLSGKYGHAIRNIKGVEQVSKAGMKARAQFGAAAIAAGTAYGYWRDPGAGEASIASSIMGPAFVPAAAGIAFGKGLKKSGVVRGARDAAIEYAQSVPKMADESNIRMIFSGERLKPLRPLRRFLGQ